jgi:hypothetical protein
VDLTSWGVLLGAAATALMAVFTAMAARKTSDMAKQTEGVARGTLREAKAVEATFLAQNTPTIVPATGEEQDALPDRWECPRMAAHRTAGDGAHFFIRVRNIGNGAAVMKRYPEGVLFRGSGGSVEVRGWINTQVVAVGDYVFVRFHDARQVESEGACLKMLINSAEAGNISDLNDVHVVMTYSDIGRQRTFQTDVTYRLLRDGETEQRQVLFREVE